MPKPAYHFEADPVALSVRAHAKKGRDQGKQHQNENDNCQLIGAASANPSATMGANFCFFRNGLAAVVTGDELGALAPIGFTF